MASLSYSVVQELRVQQRKVCIMKFVFCGTLVHSTPERVMEVLHDRIMGIDLNGKVRFSLELLDRYFFCTFFSFPFNGSVHYVNVG